MTATLFAKDSKPGTEIELELDAAQMERFLDEIEQQLQNSNDEPDGEALSAAMPAFASHPDIQISNTEIAAIVSCVLASCSVLAHTQFNNNLTALFVYATIGITLITSSFAVIEKIGSSNALPNDSGDPMTQAVDQFVGNLRNEVGTALQNLSSMVHETVYFQSLLASIRNGSPEPFNFTSQLAMGSVSFSMSFDEISKKWLIKVRVLELNE